ncbi:ATP-binding cassette domain-containing protein [Anaerosacchariphilus polymeriproducens]|uniref:ABC transporter ATP-binding protein n=1 Tax=Anaerosacchariphilus polymeriproducens TaxID=1812858 RepID=A0A371AVI1_9FIRM|nr:ABC transporter ATP-binding protein [Anaerosacchariphilus polymeriproducens]RDU23573.1 ABC transporter ATP-binding protein [Anaerosacchariphilus polymeriproducens]
MDREDIDEAAILCKGLCLQHGYFAIENLDFELKKGYITGLIGRNGAGKTTLIKMIGNSIDREQGMIYYDGMVYNGHEVLVKKKISIVYSKPNINLNATPKNIACALDIIEPWFSYEYFSEKMFQLKLDDKMKLRKYSNGMLKKFMLILALSRRPEILILDEPTSEVDPVSRVEMLDMIQEFMEDENHTVLFSTHITSDLDKIADYVTMIQDGKILFSDEKESLKKQFSSGVNLPSIEEIMCRESLKGE